MGTDIKLTLHVLKDFYLICRFQPGSEIPNFDTSEFYSVTGTTEELSLVCKQADTSEKFPNANKNWRVLKIIGPLDFSLTGILAEISSILKNVKIPIFTISTYGTDYILVKNDFLPKAMNALMEKGYGIRENS